MGRNPWQATVFEVLEPVGNALVQWVEYFYDNVVVAARNVDGDVIHRRGELAPRPGNDARVFHTQFNTTMCFFSNLCGE